MRKTRADTLEGELKAMRNAGAIPLQPPWPLPKDARPIWNEIMERRARDEWQPIDLRFAHELAGVLVAGS